jgi:prefoldin subunit 5
MSTDTRSTPAMETPIQIVGCVLASKPSAALIDAFVAQARLERAVVITKTVHSAIFVKMGAQDAALITLAFQTLRAQARARLRFGFVAGSKVRTSTQPSGPSDATSASHHHIAQASELAAGADVGEVLLTPDLAALLVEAGFALRSRQVRLADGRIVPACQLDQAAAERPAGERVAADLQERRDAIDALDRRLEQMHKATGELEGLRATLDSLLGRAGALESKIATIESRRPLVDEVHACTATITHVLGDVQVNLEMLNEQRAVIDHVGDQLARLDFTVQEAQNTLRALQREREMAERIEQSIKARRTRGGLAAVAADDKG